MSLCKSEEIRMNLVTLTPTRRLANSLTEKSFAMSFQQWGIDLVHTLAQKGLISPYTLLSDAQCELVWLKIITESDESYTAFAAMALKTWSLFHQWDLTFQDPVFLDDETSKIWRTWALQFQKILSEHQWFDSQTLLQYLLQLLEDKSLSDILPKKIILLGFTNFSPFEKKLIALLRKQGVMITEKQNVKTALLCTRQAFEDEETELNAMVQWAYEKSLQGSVACVIPQLSSLKKKIIALFERYFGEDVLFNISLGNPLSSCPLIKAAFIGLKLLEDHLAAETISEFLLSPFYEHSENQLSSRALLDINLKSQLPLSITKTKLTELLDKHEVSQYFNTKIDLNMKQDLKTWTLYFKSHLKMLGWPSQKSQSFEEIQLMNHWDILLETFESLSVTSEKINFSVALKILHQLATQTIFQTKRNPDTKIEILGILEAAGLSFDAIWVAGMHEHAWPLQGSPNPFLPLKLQRQHKMPQSNAEQNIQFCKAITHQLLHSAKEIVVSYPKTMEGNLCEPSVLIEHIPENNITLPIYSKQAIKLMKSLPSLALDPGQSMAGMTTVGGKKTLSECEDFKGSALDIEKSSSYGSEVFKDQAACPFRAFAKHRLKAKKIELPELGLKALTRGNLVHKILEKFFKQISTHLKLCHLDKNQLDEMIKTIIHETLERIENNVFTQVEKIRLRQLILNWLDKEKIDRKPFTVIATEETLKTTLGKLPLHLRIDRIDKLENELYLIIDYKTGRVNFKPENIDDEPQLPLYAVVSTINVDSIAFAQIRTDEMKFKQYQQQKEQWKASLLQLADDFIAGHAIIKPKYGKETCQYCELASLCRIKESIV